MIDKSVNDQIIEYIKQGKTIGNISRALKIPTKYIRSYLIELEKSGVYLSKEDNSEEIDRKILELKAKKNNDDEIAKEVKKSVYYVKKIGEMNEAGIDISKYKNARCFNKIDKQIIQLLEEGLTQSEIARKVNLSPQAIRQRITKMRKYDIQITSKKDKRNEQILQMLEGGLTQSEIAKKIGVTQKTVSRRIINMREYGIQIPKKLKKINKKTAKYVNLSKEEIENAILNLAETRNATFEQMQEIAKNYDIDLSRTLYSANIEER